jgi:hypothetical protein
VHQLVNKETLIKLVDIEFIAPVHQLFSVLVSGLRLDVKKCKGHATGPVIEVVGIDTACS